VQDNQLKLKFECDSSVAVSLRNQIEWYFSDSNYLVSAFLQKQVSDHGGLPIKVLATFNKVKEITEDIQFIGSVLEGSKILEVSGDMIKRRLPVPTENTIDSRSIFVSGFPKARAEYKYLKEFFSNFGNVLSIRIKKRSNFEPNPHCFVEFANVDESLNYVQSGPTKWDQFTLKILPKEKYIENVRAMITPNLVIKVDISDTIDWRKIKTLFNQFGSNYTDVSSGIAYIQFNKPSSAQKAFTQLKENQLQVDGTTLTGNILTGYEEINYWLYKSGHPPIQGKINKCKRLKKPQNEDNSYETLLTKAQQELQKTDPELKLNMNYTNTNL